MFNAKKFSLTGAALAAVLIICSVVSLTSVKTIKTLDKIPVDKSTPEAYFQSVLHNGIVDSTTVFLVSLEKALSSYEFNNIKENINIGLKPTEQAVKMLSDVVDQDLTSIKNAELDGTIILKDYKEEIDYTFNLNGTKILSLIVKFLPDEDKVFFHVPEIFDTGFVLSFDNGTFAEMSSMFSLYDALFKVIPSCKTTQELLVKYAKLLFNDVKIEISNGECRIRDLNAKITTFSGDVTYSQFSNMLINVLEALKEEKGLQTAVVELFERVRASMPNLDEELLAELNEDSLVKLYDTAIEVLKNAYYENDDRIAFSFEFASDENDNLIGFKIYNDSFEVAFDKVVQGKEFERQAFCIYDDKLIFNIYEKGTEKNQVINSVFNITTDIFNYEKDVNLLTAEIKDYDYSGYRQAKSSGKIIIKDILKGVDLDAAEANDFGLAPDMYGSAKSGVFGIVRAFPKIKLEYDFNSGCQKAKINAAVSYDEINLGSVDFDVSIKKGSKISIGSRNALEVDTQNPYEILSHLNIDKLTDNIEKAGCSDIIKLLF